MTLIGTLKPSTARGAAGPGNPTRLLFITVMPSPYQRELFAAMNASNSLRAEVLYCVDTVPDRDWEATPLGQHETVLAGRTLSWLGRSAHYNPGIARIIDDRQADLVVVGDYSAPTTQLAMRHLARRRRPWVFWGEKPGFQSRGRLASGVRRLLQRPLRRASAIAAIGSWAVGPYCDLAPGVAVVDIPYSCDLSPYRAAARRRAENPEHATIDFLFSGQLIPRKGVDVLIAAFVEAAPACPAMRLLLLGSGPSRDRLAGDIPSALADRVKFLGFKQPHELPAIFAAADVFVLPSRHDGWGVVINEAAGAGLPIVASDKVGAAHDLVRPGINGFVVPGGEVEALRDAMLSLARDPSLRRQFGAASQTIANDYDLEASVARWAQLCRQLQIGKTEA